MDPCNSLFPSRLTVSAFTPSIPLLWLSLEALGNPQSLLTHFAFIFSSPTSRALPGVYYLPDRTASCVLFCSSNHPACKKWFCCFIILWVWIWFLSRPPFPSSVHPALYVWPPRPDFHACGMYDECNSGIPRPLSVTQANPFPLIPDLYQLSATDSISILPHHISYPPSNKNSS